MGGKGGWHSALAPSAAVKVRDPPPAPPATRSIPSCRRPNAATQDDRRSGGTSTQRPPPAAGFFMGQQATRRSDVEAEGAKLLAPVVGDALRTPRRQPHPVDAEVRHHAVERLPGLVLDHVR